MNIKRRWIWLFSALSLIACKDDKPKGGTPAPDRSATAAPSAQTASSTSPSGRPALGNRPRPGTPPPSPRPAASIKPPKRSDAKDTPEAHLHLPAQCDIMGHFDIAGTLGQAAIKEQLVPQVQGALKDRPNLPGGLHGFLDGSGIRPLEDLRSAAFCVRDTTTNNPSLVLIVSGKLVPGAVAPAAVAANPRQYKMRKLGGVDVATVGKSQIVGQANDGVMLLATGEALFEAALGTGKSAAQAKLPTDKTLSAIITGATMKAAAERAGDSPFKPHLVKIKRVTHVTHLKDNSSITRIEMPDKTSATEFGGALKAAISQLQGGRAPLPPMLVSLLKEAQISYQGSTVVITVKLPKGKLEALIKMAAGGMLQRRGGPMLRGPRAPIARPKSSPKNPGF